MNIIAYLMALFGSTVWFYYLAKLNKFNKLNKPYL